MGEPRPQKGRFSTISAGFFGLLIVSAILALLNLVAFAFRIDYGIYGWYAALVYPFVVGLVSAILVRYGESPTYWECNVSTVWSFMFFAFASVFFGVKGITFIAYGAIVGVPLSLIGALAGYGIREYRFVRKNRGY